MASQNTVILTYFLNNGHQNISSQHYTQILHDLNLSYINTLHIEISTINLYIQSNNSTHLIVLHVQHHSTYGLS